VVLHSVVDYQSVFGGLWQPSTLSYAVEHYFENGGRAAVVVRVANGGAPATITLPCGRNSLTLAALSPGSREFLRASVDYDNVKANESDRFNLVVQRVRTPGSEHIEDQEIFRRLSTLPGTARYVATALEESGLVRVLGAVPATRPDLTIPAGSRQPIGYVDSNPDGDDGASPTDYDVIGSPTSSSGLFALDAVEDLRFVCIPPLTRDRDLGPGVLVVAERLCRERRAILIVDPPAAWATFDAALDGMRRFEFRSDHALLCFPRVVAFDRLRGQPETFANGGAVAGALARLDEQCSPWETDQDGELLLRPGTRPQIALGPDECLRLAARGVNPLQSLRSPGPQTLPLRTLAGGTAPSTDGTLLGVQRRRQLILASIERGTRWAVSAASNRNVWHRLEQQVVEFLQPLADAGAFGVADDSEPFTVVCDEQLNGPDDVAAGRVCLLVSLREGRSGACQSFLVTHSRDGSSVRPVRFNVWRAGSGTPVRATADGSPSSAVAPDGSESASAGRLDTEAVADADLDPGRRRQQL
jgi:hypothetical protein